MITTVDFSKAKKYELDGLNLTLNDIHHIAYAKPGEIFLSINSESMEKMCKSREYILKIASGSTPVYGINTGFGALSKKYIGPEDLEKLQLNIIRSHCTGVGKPFSIPVARAIMLTRANCLIQGFSGINPEIVQLILDFINFGLTPIIPEKGSVGASGDLAPLSHMSLALIGEGDVYFQGKEYRSSLALHLINKEPAALGPKDGLSLVNGTSVMLALGSLALIEAEKLAKTADIIGALTLEAVRGTRSAFDINIHELKPHPGQLAVAENLNKILTDTEISQSHKNCGKVQDPYSLRCIPQVHGAIRQTIQHTRDVLEREILSVTDNPLVFVDQNKVVSGGNFHGEALALTMDYLAMGLSEFCNICERRIEKMMNPEFSDLPAFLAPNAGVESGLMIAQVTAAALVSENKYLCHPASVDSVPTSTDKEDHVSMGVTSGRKLWEVVENLKVCLSIELLCAGQGIEFLRPLKTSAPLESVMNLLRRHVPPIETDRVFSNDINNIKNLIDGDEIVHLVEKEIGGLK